MSTVKLIVSRHGDNLFVDGLHGRHGSVQLVTSLTPKDRAIEPGCRVYLRAYILNADTVERDRRHSHTTDDMRAKLIVDRVMVELVRWDDRVVLKRSIGSNQITIKYDPWSHIAAGSGNQGPDGTVDGAKR